MAVYPNQKKHFFRIYLIAWVLSFLAAMVVIFLWALISGNAGEGFSPIAIPFVFTLVFLMSVTFYFYVPLSTGLLLFFAHDFVFKERGGKSTLISILLAVACWTATFPVALGFVDMVAYDFQILQIQTSIVLYLIGGSNLVGLIGAVLWVKRRKQKI